MQTHDLTDIQWAFLDLLMRAKSKGIEAVNRMEMLSSTNIPDGLKLKLTMAGLLMANGPLVEMRGQHDFLITTKGEQVYNLRFNNPEPTAIADEVIALPDASI